MFCFRFVIRSFTHHFCDLYDDEKDLQQPYRTHAIQIVRRYMLNFLCPIFLLHRVYLDYFLVNTPFLLYGMVCVTRPRK